MPQEDEDEDRVAPWASAEDEPDAVELLRLHRLEVSNQALLLTEHFDSVQIIVTVRNEDGTTGLFAVGNGNIYARYGSVRDWLRDQGQLS